MHFAASVKVGSLRSFAALGRNDCYADKVRIRCTRTNVRIGEPLNKRSFLEGYVGCPIET